MSARTELEHYLTFSGHGPQKRKALIDAFAHELAEEIRRYADDEFPDGDSNPQEFYGDWGSFFREAADLIDPEAAGSDGAGPVRPDEEPAHFGNCHVNVAGHRLINGHCLYCGKTPAEMAGPGEEPTP